MAYKEEEAEEICHFCDQPACGLMEWEFDHLKSILTTYVAVCDVHASMIVNTKLSIAALPTYVKGY